MRGEAEVDFSNDSGGQDVMRYEKSCGGLRLAYMDK